MSAFLLLLLCLGLGLALSRSSLFPPNAPITLNNWLLNIALPAVVLERIPQLQFDHTLMVPILAPWLVIVGAAVLIPMVGRALGWERGVIGALVLTCGLGNTSFIGLPLIGVLMGPTAIGPALIADQLGTFIALSTAGIAIAGYYAGGQPRAREIVLRVLRFPPFLALILAFVVRAGGGWPPAILPTLEPVLLQLGATLTPIALFSVGLQFRLGALREYLGPLLGGLSWKLLLAPLMVLILARSFGISGQATTVGILQAAMAPMISAGILAQQHGLAPRLATLVVSLGTLASLISVPLFWIALR